MMAICHTAVPERKDGKIAYQAASPGRSHLHQYSQQKLLDIEYAALVFSQTMTNIYTRLSSKEKNRKPEQNQDGKQFFLLLLLMVFIIETRYFGMQQQIRFTLLVQLHSTFTYCTCVVVQSLTSSKHANLRHLQERKMKKKEMIDSAICPELTI